MELRELKATDMGAICRIITAVGLKEVKKCFSEDSMKAIRDAKDGNIDAMGVSILLDIAGIIVSNIPVAEREIQSFVASVTGLKLTEVQKLSLADFGEVVVQIVMKEDFKDFFQRVIKLFK